MHRIVLIACTLALALVASACGGSSASSTPADSTTTTASPSRPATTQPGGPTETTVDPAVAEVRARIDELIIEAQQIRGLAFLEPVDVVLLADADYEARIVGLLAEELTDEEIDSGTALFRLLGVIGPEANLRDAYDTLYSSGTGGFYNQKTEELVVRLADGELGQQSQAVVVHELTHALQDQHFEVLDSLEDLEGDALYVARALGEGDALLRELTYIESLGSADQAAWRAEYSASLADAEAAHANLPGYLVNSLQAPYLDGLFFHQRVGLDGVDALFDDPPESSEQILDHDKYQDDEQPLEVVLPELSLDGYEVYFDATMGQKDIELLLSEAVDAKQAGDAALGWGGDSLRIYTRGDRDAVFVLAYKGDSKADAAELAASFSDYEDAMLPAGSFSLIQNNGADSLVIFASDSSLSSQLRAAFAG